MFPGATIGGILGPAAYLVGCLLAALLFYGTSRIAARLFGRRIAAVAALTLKAAFRYRLIQILLGLLLLAVVGLPSIIKHDGTAQGFTQILLTYTLGSITVLLGFATLWLGCGSLARDIEECQMQLVVVKPVARWEVWLGKWLGLLFLNGSLLATSGLAVYGLLEWRASRLPPELQSELHSKILVARGSAKETVNYDRIQTEADRQVEARLKDPSLATMDRNFVRTQVVARVKAQYQLVPGGHQRRWTIPFGSRANSLRDQPLTVRVKFYSPLVTTLGGVTYQALWEAGPPETRRWQSNPMSLAPETFHEFQIPPGLIDPQGLLTIDFLNYNDADLLFPFEEGLEILYPESSFAINFARGLVIILCWMGLLAAIGLAFASFLSFPVAAFCSLAVLIVGFSTGTLRQIIEEGGISSVNPETGMVDAPSLLDRAAVPAFRTVLWTINLVRGFSPIDSLSSGRSVSWGQLALAFTQIVLLMGGLFAALGVATFHRRELATAQGP